MNSWSTNPDYPKNLIKAIFTDTVWNDDEKRLLEECMALPLDVQIPAVEYVLCTFNEREHDIIHYRYMYGMTKTDVANTYHISVSRAVQIENRILRMLRRERLIKFLRYGVNGVIERAIQATKGDLNISSNDTGDGPKIYEKPIDDLSLSVRPMNALYRANVNTVGEIVERFKQDTISYVPNLGDKSIQEIYKSLIRIGISPEELKSN